MNRLQIVAVTAWATLLAGPSDAATVYSFVALEFPGSTNTYATGIGSDGTIIGLSAQASYMRTPAGSYVPLDFPGRIYTTALGISSAGVIVGDVYDPDTQTYIGFIRTPDGAYTDFRYPNVVGPGDGQQANDINAAGVIVGGGASSFGHGAYIRSPDGTFQVFQYQGDPTTIAYGINDAGYITGQSSACHCSFLRAPDGTFTQIAYPGAFDTQAFGLNNHNQIVGLWYHPDLGVHGFRRDPDGTYANIDAPGLDSTHLWDINDAGVLVGHRDINHSAARAAFVATPMTTIPVTPITWSAVKQRYR